MVFLRKFLAALVLSLFVSFVPPLVITESVLRTNVISGSYTPATQLLADQFAKSDADRALFKERIRTAFSELTYDELLAGVSKPLLAQLENASPQQNQFVLDLGSLKQKMREVLPGIVKNFPECGTHEAVDKEFRFCKARAMGSPARFEAMATDVIEKQIPSHFVLNGENNPQVMQAIHSISIIKKYILPATLVVGIFLLGLIALIIFSPLSSVLAWVGSSLLLLEILLGLFAYSLQRLPEIIPNFKDVSAAQLDILKFGIGAFNAAFSLWIVVVGVLSVATLVGAFIFKARKP